MTFLIEMSAAYLVIELCPKCKVHQSAQNGYVLVYKAQCSNNDFRLLKEMLIECGYIVRENYSEISP